jgi:hypothetical protein
MINAPNQAFGYFLPQNFKIGPIYMPIVSISANCFGNASFCGPILSKLKKVVYGYHFFHHVGLI